MSLVVIFLLGTKSQIAMRLYQVEFIVLVFTKILKYYSFLSFLMLYFHLFCLAVSKLDVFIDQAFTGDNGLVFSSGITLDSFRQLYSSPFESHLSRTGERLTSYIYENATILPRRSIAGTYICEGRNNNGTRNTTITVDVKGTIIL